MPDRLLSVVDLKTHFRDSRTGEEIKACDGVSLEVGEGEIVGLVGESGCGKSTLGRTLVGLEKAKAGEIRYRGENLLAMRGKELTGKQRHIQYIFQDSLASLSTRQTIGQAIEEALIINGERNGAARTARVRELLEAVSLPEQIADRYPREMSGGQRQRACIARSLAAEPKVLICDEPVSSLDVSIRAQVMNLFLKLRDELGDGLSPDRTRSGIVRQAAQRVYVMHSGDHGAGGEPCALRQSFSPLHAGSPERGPVDQPHRRARTGANSA